MPRSRTWCARRDARSDRGRAASANTLLAFCTTVALWVLPGLAALVLGQDSDSARWLTALLPESVVAILGASLLFVLPTRFAQHEFTLPWDEAVKIDWWIVFLYGGGIALGTLAFQTGLAEALGRAAHRSAGVRSEIGLLALSTAIATLLSETTSNTASANMVVPVVIAFARSSGIDPVLAGDRGDDGCVARVHDAGLDAVQRDRLRVGSQSRSGR
jgi:sodium-dependent dicarboxylate transporter 2/3/5